MRQDVGQTAEEEVERNEGLALYSHLRVQREVRKTQCGHVVRLRHVQAHPREFGGVRVHVWVNGSPRRRVFEEDCVQLGAVIQKIIEQGLISICCRRRENEFLERSAVDRPLGNTGGRRSG